MKIHRASRLDERHDTADVLSAVETDSRIDPTVIHVARQIAPGVHTATYHELFPFGVEPHVLQVRIVLIRPEPVNLVVRDALAKHVARGCGALFDGVLPVLYPNVATEDRVMVIRDVTGGVIPLTFVWQYSSTTMPLSTWMPLPPRISKAGSMPMPTTAKSQ